MLSVFYKPSHNRYKTLSLRGYVVGDIELYLIRKEYGLFDFKKSLCIDKNV